MASYLFVQAFDGREWRAFKGGISRFVAQVMQAISPWRLSMFEGFGSIASSFLVFLYRRTGLVQRFLHNDRQIGSRVRNEMASLLISWVLHAMFL